MIIYKKRLLILFACASFNVNAGIGTSLDSFYNGLGYDGNRTNPSTFQGQSANYYNGGSLSLRTNIINAQLASVTLPDVSIGCNGIDAFMGGFSHISSDALVQFGKAVVANAVPFAVDLALQTWAPQIKQIRDNLQSIADKFLNQSINSCETAQAAIGGLAAFAAPATRKHVCSTMGTQNNAFADWVSATNECGVGGEATAQLKEANKVEAFKGITKTSHNIVWSALMQNEFLSNDKSLAEVLMSFSGTYIYDGNGNPTYFPSLLNDNSDSIESLLTGGDVDYYACDNQGTQMCLNLTKTKLSISSTKALEEKVYDVLKRINTALINDTSLTTADQTFLAYTKLPVLAFLMDYAADGGVTDSLLRKYSRVMGVELLAKYLYNMLGVTEFSLSNTKNDKVDVDLIRQDMSKARKYLASIELTARESLIVQEELIANAKVRKKQLLKSVSKNIRDNLFFGAE